MVTVSDGMPTLTFSARAEFRTNGTHRTSKTKIDQSLTPFFDRIMVSPQSSGYNRRALSFKIFRFDVSLSLGWLTIGSEAPGKRLSKWL